MTAPSLFLDALTRFSGARVLCVGDVMLDRFIYGAVDRISPEAPIPVLLVQQEKYMLGGAGNVVSNIAALGAQARLLTVVGDDAPAREIRHQLELRGIAGLPDASPARVTTVKSRFISGPQQLLRVDREKADALSAEDEKKLVAAVEKAVADCDAVILSDYGKGVLTDAVVAAVIHAAQAAQKPVVVDPKGRDFARYRGASVITPNRKEIETATGLPAGTDAEVLAAAGKIIRDCGIPTVLATRSKDGMSLVTQDAPPLHIAANVRAVFDVSGAGDTVIAAFTAGLAAGMAAADAARLANIAAGIVVGKPGTATVTPEEIRDILGQEQRPAGSKLAALPEAVERVAAWRAAGQKIGFTNGCFDLLHPGHLSSLRQARDNCDRLVVAINSDASVSRLKGPTRPVQDEQARAAVLSALEIVDLVLIFGDDTPMALLEALRPDVLVKGGQYKLEEVVGYELITSYGGRIVRADMAEGYSTTNTVGRMTAGG